MSDAFITAAGDHRARAMGLCRMCAGFVQDSCRIRFLKLIATNVYLVRLSEVFHRFSCRFAGLQDVPPLL